MLSALALTALTVLNQNFDSRSQLFQEKPFNFYESCEPMPVQVWGKDPVTGQGRDISVTVYRPRPSTKKSVLIIPPTGGVGFLEQGYGDRMCQKGLEAWVITEWAPELRDFKVGFKISSHDQAARQALAAVRQIVSHMPGQVGILGTSAGAIIGATAAAIEPRIKVALLIAGGAQLPSLIAHSKLESIEQLNQARMSQLGVSPSQYQRLLEKGIKVDPVHFGPSLRKKKIGVVLSTSDDIVPTQNQLLLEKISGAERVAEFDKSHAVSILLTGLIKSYKIERFFQNNL